jgi:hypothetical protein
MFTSEVQYTTSDASEQKKDCQSSSILPTRTREFHNMAENLPPMHHRLWQRK